MAGVELNTLYDNAQKGDPAAEKLLFDSLAVRFRAFARRKLWGRQEYEDVVQDALAVVWREYRDLRIESSFSAWAYKVLKNKMMTYTQTIRRRENWVIPLAEAAEFLSSDGLDPGFSRRLLECLRKIGSANLRYSRVLNFHYQGYTTAEICTKMKLRQSAFYVILSRARSWLKNCLEEGEIK